MSSISAVVLSYRKRWIFPTFVRSLLAQTVQPSQIIVVDDGSRDGTADMVRGLRSGWAKLLLPKNRGQSYARNVGAAHANGTFIIFLDGDIEMHPRMMELLRGALLRNAGASIAYCHYNRAGIRGDPVRARPWDPVVLRNSNFVSMMSMVRRAHLPNPPFDVGLRRYEDWDLWRRMAAQGRRGVMVDHILFTAYYNHGDLSGAGESRGWYERVKRKRQCP